MHHLQLLAEGADYVGIEKVVGRRSASGLVGPVVVIAESSG